MLMNSFSGMKFIASYSGGKDSVLAINRAVNAGMLPIGLITANNINSKRTWFHGADQDLLEAASDSLAMPLTYISTPGDAYADNFEKALLAAKDMGAQVCVFGDIDIRGHLDWCAERCENTGLMPCFPLRDESRKKVVYEFIDAGFRAVIKIVDTARLPEVFLGQTLSRNIVDEIERIGADICGENGEYHTFVYGGPLFSHDIGYTIKDKSKHDKYAVLEIRRS